MTEVDEAAVERDMDAEEADLAQRIYAAAMRYSNYSERAAQSHRFQAGISDLGWCSERLRRMVGQEAPDDRDVLPAFLGTAIGDHLERAVKDADPSVLIQEEVRLVLKGETNHYDLSGHPDMIFPRLGYVIDGKTTNGLTIARRSGLNQQKQFQRHCYGLAAWEGGLLGEIAVEEVKVGNCWVDRSGVDREFFVDLEPLDLDIVAEAGEWLDEVVYAYLHDQEARKEPPREVCLATCGFFSTCRALDTDVEGLLTDDTVLTAIQMYREGGELEKQGKRLRTEATAALRNVIGTDGKFAIRWVHVNPTHVSYDRRGYDRLTITEMK